MTTEKETRLAFARAIREGRLTENPTAYYAPYFEYVGKSPETGLDLFVNRSTRAYLPAKHPWQE